MGKASHIKELNRHRFVGFLVALVIITPSAPATAQQRYPSASWDVASSPEALGYSSLKLQEAEEYTRGIHTAAVISLRSSTRP